MLGLGLNQWPKTGSVAAAAVNGDIIAAAVNADGWTMDVTLKGASATGNSYAFDLNGTPKFTVSVTSRSWTTGGVETTKARTLYGTDAVRLPYPNETTLDETDDGSDMIVRVSLSEYVYADDANISITTLANWLTGGQNANAQSGVSVTNNSTRDYQKPIAAWAQHDLEWAEASTHTVKLSVAHAHFEQGKMAVAVKFTATDESANSVSAFATSMSTETFTASAKTISYFTTDIDLSTLTQGEMITVDAEIYPWVGDSFTISTDADSYPSPNLTVLKFLNDKSGTYGKVYAYVDPTSGGDGSGVASATAGTAQASPFETISAAAAAAVAVNNTNNSRNNTSGCIVRLEEDTYSAKLGADTMDGLADGDVPLIIEAVGAVANTVFQANDSNNNDIPDLTKWVGITFDATGNFIVLDGAASTTAQKIIFEDCVFATSGGTHSTAYIYRYGTMYCINCSTDGELVNSPINRFSTQFMELALVAGCDIRTTGIQGLVARAALGCVTKNQEIGDTDALHANAPDPIGVFIGWNFMSNSVAGQAIEVWHRDLEASPRGVAVIGNVLERSASTGPMLDVYAAGTSAEPCSNVVIAGNTVIGERCNLFYNFTAEGNETREGVARHNVIENENNKGDVFDSDGALVGNWPFRWHVGGDHNAIDHTAAEDPPTPAPSSWYGEIAAIGDVLGATFDFTDDQSASGGGSGFGDYTLGGSTTVPNIPAGKTGWPKDQDGVAIPANGTAFAGALQ